MVKLLVVVVVAQRQTQNEKGAALVMDGIEMEESNGHLCFGHAEPIDTKLIVLENVTNEVWDACICFFCARIITFFAVVFVAVAIYFCYFRFF